MTRHSLDIIECLGFIAIISAYLAWCLRTGTVYVRWGFAHSANPIFYWMGIAVIALMDLWQFLRLAFILHIIDPT